MSTSKITTTGGALPDKIDYYLRVGARVWHSLNFNNYNEVKTLALP